jgi:hypothetical protein
MLSRGTWSVSREMRRNIAVPDRSPIDEASSVTCGRRLFAA